MDRRTKILGAFFGVMIGYGLIAQVVYPQWIQPLLTLDERIAALLIERDDLERAENRVKMAKADYREYLGRIGSPDWVKVDIDLRSRLNELIGKNGLQAANVTAGRPTAYGKAGLDKFSIEVSAEASLQSVIQFLKEVSELPPVIRMGNVRLAKMGGTHSSRETDRVSLSLPLEVMVLPKQKLVGPVEGGKPGGTEAVVRHENRDYSRIWDRRPFIEFEPTRAIAINIRQKTVTAKQGTPASLQATVSGGNGELKYAWSPADGLTNPVSLSPKVDTSTPGAKIYTLTVTDARGQTASESVTVSVQEPQQAVQEPQRPPEPPPPPPPPPKDQPWPDGRFIQVNMAMSTFYGPQRLDELMVYNTKSRASEFYKVGDAFDGGELIFVHQRGGVVRRNDKYFLYPIGIKLDGAIEAEAGAPYPELLEAVNEHREQHSEGTAERLKTGGQPTSGPPLLIGHGASSEDDASQLRGEMAGQADGESPPKDPASAPEVHGATAGTLPPAELSGTRGQAGKRTNRSGGTRTPPRKSGNQDPQPGGDKKKTEPPEPVPE